MKLLQKAYQDLLDAPRSLFLAAITLIVGIVLSSMAVHYGADLSSIILILVITNSMAQMCIDFFPATSKPFFSAIARVIPAIAAIAAYWALNTK